MHGACRAARLRCCVALTGKRIPAILALCCLRHALDLGGALEVKPYALHVLLGVLALLFRAPVLGKMTQTPAETQAGSASITARPGNSGRRDFTRWRSSLPWADESSRFSFHRACVCGRRLAHAQTMNRGTLVRGALLAPCALALAYIPIRANYFIAQQDPANWQLYQREDAIPKYVTEYFINSAQGFINRSPPGQQLQAWLSFRHRTK